MHRALSSYILQDLRTKVVLLSGPRQVGKTTLSKALVKNFTYLNFDSIKDRKIIQQQEWPRDTALLVLDEIHKMRQWKTWLKGVYDTEGVKPPILVTGSARLDVFRKGGDSLAGRHFSHVLHPFTVKELLGAMPPEQTLAKILACGGFPEPFLHGTEQYAARWRGTHLDIILRQDLLDLERVREIRNIEILIELLAERVGTTVSYQSLAEDIGVSIHTIKHWLEILERLYVIFKVSPYSKNITGSFRKESKYFFFDTAQVNNGMAARLENAVAGALLAELSFLANTQGKKVALHFIRDKQKHEVDFLTLVDHKATALIEVKAKDDAFAPALFRFRERLRNPGLKCFQVVHELYKAKDSDGVKMLRASDFLAQLPIHG